MGKDAGPEAGVPTGGNEVPALPSKGAWDAERWEPSFAQEPWRAGAGEPGLSQVDGVV